MAGANRVGHVASERCGCERGSGEIGDAAHEDAEARDSLERARRDRRRRGAGRYAGRDSPPAPRRRRSLEVGHVVVGDAEEILGVLHAEAAQRRDLRRIADRGRDAGGARPRGRVSSSMSTPHTSRPSAATRCHRGSRRCRGRRRWRGRASAGEARRARVRAVSTRLRPSAGRSRGRARRRRSRARRCRTARASAARSGPARRCRGWPPRCDAARRAERGPRWTRRSRSSAPRVRSAPLPASAGGRRREHAGDRQTWPRRGRRARGGVRPRG